MYNFNHQIFDTEVLPSRRTVKAARLQSKVIPLDAGNLLISDALNMYLKENAEFEKRTKQDYVDHLRYLRAWAAEEEFDFEKLSDLTEELVIEYRSYLIERYAQHTVNIRISTLHAFLQWAYKEGYLDPIFLKAKKIEVNDDGVRYLKDDEVRRLLNIIDPTYFEGFRDYVAVCVMLDCGIRISELLNVTWDMVNWDDNTISVPGRIAKNGKLRTVPLSAQNTMPLLRRLQMQNQAKFGDHRHLFLSYRGTPLESSSVRHLLQRYATQAGIPRVSPHMLRHTFACSYVRSGGNLYMLQEILGHSTLEMTRRYVKMFPEDIIREHQRLSPTTRFL